LRGELNVCVPHFPHQLREHYFKASFIRILNENTFHYNYHGKKTPVVIHSIVDLMSSFKAYDGYDHIEIDEIFTGE